MKPTHIIIHCSATPDGQTLSWQAIRKYHIVTNGWRDIGYHFGVELVNSEYEIVVGRMLGEQGAHCPEQGMNRKAIGICVVGDFDRQSPPAAQMKLLRRLVMSLMEMLSIPVENVHGHREFNSHKTCPGRSFNMEAFRASLGKGAA